MPFYKKNIFLLPRFQTGGAWVPNMQTNPVNTGNMLQLVGTPENQGFEQSVQNTNTLLQFNQDLRANQGMMMQREMMEMRKKQSELAQKDLDFRIKKQELEQRSAFRRELTADHIDPVFLEQDAALKKKYGVDTIPIGMDPLEYQNNLFKYLDDPEHKKIKEISALVKDGAAKAQALEAKIQDAILKDPNIAMKLNIGDVTEYLTKLRTKIGNLAYVDEDGVAGLDPEYVKEYRNLNAEMEGLMFKLNPEYQKTADAVFKSEMQTKMATARVEEYKANALANMMAVIDDKNSTEKEIKQARINYAAALGKLPASVSGVSTNPLSLSEEQSLTLRGLKAQYGNEEGTYRFHLQEQLAKNAASGKGQSFQGMAIDDGWLDRWNTSYGEKHKAHINKNGELVIKDVTGSSLLGTGMVGMGGMRDELIKYGIVRDADKHLDDWAADQGGTVALVDNADGGQDIYITLDKPQGFNRSGTGTGSGTEPRRGYRNLDPIAGNPPTDPNTNVDNPNPQVINTSIGGGAGSGTSTTGGTTVNTPNPPGISSRGRGANTNTNKSADTSTRRKGKGTESTFEPGSSNLPINTEITSLTPNRPPTILDENGNVKHELTEAELGIVPKSQRPKGKKNKSWYTNNIGNHKVTVNGPIPHVVDHSDNNNDSAYHAYFETIEDGYAYHFQRMRDALNGNAALAVNGVDTSIRELMSKYSLTEGDEEVLVKNLKEIDGAYRDVDLDTTFAELKNIKIGDKTVKEKKVIQDLSNAIAMTEAPELYQQLPFNPKPGEFRILTRKDDGEKLLIGFDPGTNTYLVYDWALVDGVHRPVKGTRVNYTREEAYNTFNFFVN